ncbi:MAG TPA: hypothetical protein VF813_08495 [Anaerolineaceae bacterium]
MRKTIPITLIIAGLAGFLAGCAAQPAAAPLQTQAPPTAPAVTATTASMTPARCTVESQVATASPTDTSLYPPPSSSDWSNGPAGAAVTFIEYGDFM